MAQRPGPTDRVRARLSAIAGPDVALRLPRGYQRLGRILLVRLPEALRPYFPHLGGWYAEELSVDAIYRPTGPIEGEWRRPRLERLWGDRTETEVLEHGIRWRLDVTEVMFARGNKTERARMGELVRPGERVADLFAGIGYFTIPIARGHPSVRVVAVEANPASFRYLEENLERNGVRAQVETHLGDNRTVGLPPGRFDRVVLGYLPSSMPWVARAVELLRSDGGALHVHLVSDSRERAGDGERAVTAELERLGAGIVEVTGREVKPYGPGRTHVVVDVRLRPPASAGDGGGRS